jgi:branched-subunit amino acid transport protein AzlD
MTTRQLVTQNSQLVVRNSQLVILNLIQDPVLQARSKMNKEFLYLIALIALMAVLTYGARLFPYLLFGRKGKSIPVVTYLGDVLPPAVMILLIVYCVRNVSFVIYPYGIPEFTAIIAALGLYLLTKNNLIAMVSGTVLYMLLIQLVF